MMSRCQVLDDYMDPFNTACSLKSLTVATMQRFVALSVSTTAAGEVSLLFSIHNFNRCFYKTIWSLFIAKCLDTCPKGLSSFNPLSTTFSFFTLHYLSQTISTICSIIFYCLDLTACLPTGFHALLIAIHSFIADSHEEIFFKSNLL